MPYVDNAARYLRVAGARVNVPDWPITSRFRKVQLESKILCDSENCNLHVAGSDAEQVQRAAGTVGTALDAFAGALSGLADLASSCLIPVALSNDTRPEALRVLSALRQPSRVDAVARAK